MPLKKSYVFRGINLHQNLYNLGCIVSRKIQRLKPFPMTRPDTKADGCVLQGFPMFGVRDFGYFTSKPKNSQISDGPLVIITLCNLRAKGRFLRNINRNKPPRRTLN